MRAQVQDTEVVAVIPVGFVLPKCCQGSFCQSVPEFVLPKCGLGSFGQLGFVRAKSGRSAASTPRPGPSVSARCSAGGGLVENIGFSPHGFVLPSWPDRERHAAHAMYPPPGETLVVNNNEFTSDHAAGRMCQLSTTMAGHPLSPLAPAVWNACATPLGATAVGGTRRLITSGGLSRLRRTAKNIM